MYLGDFRAGDTIDLKFTTVNGSGVPTQLAGTPAISVYKDNGTTESMAGVTLTVDFDTRTGLNHVRITTASDGTFYSDGSEFQIVITTGTVGGSSVVGYVVGAFSLAKRSALRPTTSGRTLDVSAGGEAGVDWANVGTPSSTVNLSATTVNALGAAGVDAIWDEPMAAHTTVDTPGRVLNMLTQDSVTLSTDVNLDSIVGQLLDAGTAWSYNRSSHALEVIAGASALSQIIHPILLVPPAIDVANTATVRIGILVSNQLNDLPTTTEITPGTITIDRKAAGATSWTNVVAATAMSESAGLIYYDATFAAASGYTRGDIIRFTFAGQAVVVSSVTYEVTPAGGIYAYSWIPETNGLTEATIADAVWDEALNAHLGAGSTGAALNNIPDSVWDEVMESGAPANAQTARQWFRILMSFAVGLDAGVGDWSARALDGSKTRIAGLLSAAGKRLGISIMDGS